jgi:hypothetical protein
MSRSNALTAVKCSGKLLTRLKFATFLPLQSHYGVNGSDHPLQAACNNKCQKTRACRFYRLAKHNFTVRKNCQYAEKKGPAQSCYAPPCFPSEDPDLAQKVPFGGYFLLFHSFPAP